MTAKLLIEGHPHDARFKELSTAIDAAVKDVVGGLQQYATPQKKIFLGVAPKPGELGGYWRIRHGETPIIDINFGEIELPSAPVRAAGPFSSEAEVIKFVLEAELLVALKNPVKDMGGLQRIVFKTTATNSEIAGYISNVMTSAAAMAEAAVTDRDDFYDYQR